MFANARKAVAAGLGSLLTVLVFTSENLGWALPANVEVPLGIAVGLLTPVVTWLVKPGKGIVTPPAQPA